MTRATLRLVATLCITLLVAASGYGQKGVIKVIAQKSREPVAFAHVCFEGMITGTAKYGLTSIEGTLVNESTERSKVVISYMGYKTVIDTLDPGESRTIEMIANILNMDEVVVTAQYTPERVDKSIYKIEVINARQIEQKGATNMAELLQDQSNMRVTQDGVLGTSLRIQGLSGENVKFLQDGVPLIGRMNGNFDLNQLNLYNVDHVEVIEGPMSVIYGSNALAGVVNIITRENKTSLLSASANGYYESVGQVNFDASVSSSFKKHGFLLDGGRNFFGGWDPSGNDNRNVTYNPRRQYFANGYYLFSGTRLKLKIAGDYFNELLLDKGELLAPYYVTAFDNHFTTIRYSIHTDGSVKLNANRFVNFILSYSAYDRLKQVYFVDLTTLEKSPVEASWGHDTTSVTAWMARATFAKSNPEAKFNYQLGVDLNLESGDGKRIEGEHQQIGDYAAFLSVKWEPWHVLTIQPGLRAIYNTKYSAPLIYALSIKWEIEQSLNLRFSYAKGFRAPTIKELYMNFVDVNHNVQGNPDLKAEQSDNINLNLNWNREQTCNAWHIDLTGFYNHIRNVILLAPKENTLEYTYVNMSEYTTTGFGLTGGYNLFPEFKIQAGVTMTGITGALDAEIAPEELKWSEEVTLTSSYRFVNPELTLSLFYKYTGKAPQVVFTEDGLSWGFVNPYNSMDVTATKGFWMNRIKLSAGVKNLFNVTTVPATGSSGGHGSGGESMNISWGRTFFIKLNFTFNKYK